MTASQNSQESKVPEGQSSVSVSILPQSRKRLIGRSELVGSVVNRLQIERLVTLVGYGGVGKTSVALAAGRAWTRLSGSDVLLLDLARISDSSLVWTTILSTLGVTPLGDPRETALRLLSDRSELVILDNCEHLAAGMAETASDILQHAPGIRILATSREELRAMDEDVVRVAPLSVPPAIGGVGTGEILAHSSVELLFERMGIDDPQADLTGGDIIAAADLCQRLDGIPLAIEIAAARVGAGTIHDVIEQLAVRFEPGPKVEGGQHSRHAGLLAVLDWSYGLLTDGEQAVLRACSVFASDFGVDDVAAVLPSEMPHGMIGAALNGLSAKSMVQDVGGGRLRLLETTRAYALKRLRAEGEAQSAFDKMAAHVLAALQAAPRDDRQATLAIWERVRSDAAVALQWTLRGAGNRICGIDIVAAALPTWLLVTEISRYAQEIADAIKALKEVAPDRRAHELQFEFSRSIALYFARGPSLEGTGAGKRAYGIAVAVDAVERQLDTAWNLHAQTSHWGGYNDALVFARRYLATAKRMRDPVFINQGWRVIARAYDDLGFHKRCERLFREVVQPGAGATAKPVTAWGADEKIIRICMDARVHWFRGEKQRALEVGAHAVAVGQDDSQDHCFCWMLAQHLIPINLWAGEIDTAVSYLDLLRDVSRHNYGNWSNWAEMLTETVDVIGGERPSERLLDRIRDSWPYRQDMFATLHPDLVSDASLARAASRVEWNWSTPDIIRISAERALARGGVEQARELLVRSMTLAQTRGNTPSASLSERVLLGLE